MTASQTLSAPTPNWDVSFRSSNLPDEFLDAIQVDDDKASFAASLLAGHSVTPTNVELRYVGPYPRHSREPFIIETDEDSSVTELSIAIPSKNVKTLAEDVDTINELTIAGLQRVVDIRQHGEPLAFDEQSIRRLSPQSRKSLRKDGLLGGSITLAASGLVYLAGNILNVDQDLQITGAAFVATMGAAGSSYMLREERQWLRGRDIGWRTKTVKAKEEEHYTKAILKVSDLLPIMTVKTDK